MITDDYTRHGAAISNVTIRVLPNKRLTSQDAINAVVAAEGDLDLAAERLFGYTPTSAASAASALVGDDEPATPLSYTNKTKLVALLAEDPSTQQDLQRILRTLSMLKAFSTFNLVATTVDGTLDNMNANERAKFMKNLLDSLAVLTDDHTQTVNSNNTNLNVGLTEAVMKNLSPDVREAIKVLTAGEGNGNGNNETIEAEWSLGDAPPNAAVD